MNETWSNCRTAPDTAGWLIFSDSASSAAVSVPSGLTSIAPITRADIVGTPLFASTPAKRSTNWLTASRLGSSAMVEPYSNRIYRKYHKLLICWHRCSGDQELSEPSDGIYDMSRFR